MRIVVDTNVLVSGFMTRGIPGKVVDFILVRRAKLLTSMYVMIEYQRVLESPKFYKYPNFKDRRDKFLYFVDEFAEYIKYDFTLEIIKDKADNRFLETAQAGNADYLVTGNTTHFPMGMFGNTQIVSPARFCEIEGLE